MNMSRQVRDVFALAALIAGYGLVLWLYESKLASQWGEDFTTEPRAIFARQDRDRRIAEELDIAPSAMTVEPLEGDTDGSE